MGCQNVQDVCHMSHVQLVRHCRRVHEFARCQIVAGTGQTERAAVWRGGSREAPRSSFWFPVAFRKSVSFLRRILAHPREVELACRHILWLLDFIWKDSQSTFQHRPANKYLHTDTPCASSWAEEIIVFRECSRTSSSAWGPAELEGARALCLLSWKGPPAPGLVSRKPLPGCDGHHLPAGPVRAPNHVSELLFQ